MSKRVFIAAHPQARRNAAHFCMECPEGWAITFSEPTRNADQNALLHACLTDIAKQVDWCGKRLSVDVWKRLCTAAWLREEGESPEMIPALDGKGFDVIFERTSKLSVKQCASLTTWVQAFGAEKGVQWSEKASHPHLMVFNN